MHILLIHNIHTYNIYTYPFKTYNTNNMTNISAEAPS